MKRYKTVDDYIDNAETYQTEVRQLRKILNSTDLVEEVKWGAPCYTHNGKNLVGLGSFKSFFTLWFFQGALLADDEDVLINAQEGKTKGLRQWRMTIKKEIKTRLIKAYVKEAISLQDQGKEIKPSRDKPVVIPEPLSAAFAKHKKAAKCFEGLSKGKQREYAEHIAEAKREATKLTRIEKILPMIVAGQGLHDKYRNC